MKKYLILIIIFPCLVFAQRYDQKWLLGRNNLVPEWGISELTFGNNSLVIDSQNYPISLYATQTCMYDNQGDLMFATNGIVVWNTNMDTMLNGGGLSPSDYTNSMNLKGLNIPQGVISLPSPKQDNTYYLFHETVKWTDTTGDTPLELYYSIIDMNGDNGKGEVKVKNTVILQDTLMIGQMTACKHANGRDWWMLVLPFFGEGYYRFLLSPEGVEGPWLQIVDNRILSKSITQSVFSPDGTKYARYDEGVWTDTIGFLNVFDFDRCTGLLSNRQVITIPFLSNWGGAAGVAISPNSKYVYCNNGRQMFQFDLTAADIASSQYLLGTFDGHQSPFNSTFYQGQLAPNGKIYWSCTNGSDILHVIDYPDSLGAACSFRQHGIQLPAYARFGLPNHPNYYLGALSGSACDTLVSYQSSVSSIQNVYVYPNPTKDKVFVGMNHIPQGAILSLCNGLGQEMYRKIIVNTTQETEILLSSFPVGIYYLQVRTEGKVFTQKIIKE